MLETLFRFVVLIVLIASFAWGTVWAAQRFVPQIEPVVRVVVGVLAFLGILWLIIQLIQAVGLGF